MSPGLPPAGGKLPPRLAWIGHLVDPTGLTMFSMYWADSGELAASDCWPRVRNLPVFALSLILMAALTRVAIFVSVAPFMIFVIA